MSKSTFGFIFLWVLSGCATSSGSRADVQTEPLSDKAAVHYDIAFDSYMNGDLIPALGAALKTVELAPQNAEAHNLLGLIYFRQEKAALAEAEFKKAIAANPKSSEAYNNLGSVYLSLNRYAEARDVLVKAQENPLYLYPERIMNNLGLAYQGLGDSKEAEAHFLEAIKLNKNFFLPHMNLGRIYAERNETGKAEPLLIQAMKVCGDCSEPRYVLGKIYLKTNRSDEAVKLFKQGADVDPEGYFGQLCKKYLVQK